MISVELVQKNDRLRVRNRANLEWPVTNVCCAVGEAGGEDTSGRCGTGGTVYSRRVTHNWRVHASAQAARYSTI